ncbi:MAG: hypothetical protein WCZ23_07045 [Rhodospirillaceae bacterium]
MSEYDKLMARLDALMQSKGAKVSPWLSDQSRLPQQNRVIDALADPQPARQAHDTDICPSCAAAGWLLWRYAQERGSDDQSK